jgi:hypothetical protein
MPLSSSSLNACAGGVIPQSTSDASAGSESLNALASAGRTIGSRLGRLLHRNGHGGGRKDPKSEGDIEAVSQILGPPQARGAQSGKEAALTRDRELVRDSVTLQR